jgi:hypothetical protein
LVRNADYVRATSDHGRHNVIVRLWWLAGASAVLVPTCAYAVARVAHRRFPLALAGCVGLLLITWLVDLELQATSGDGATSDNEAGAGLVVQGAPAVLAVVILVGLGAGCAELVRRVRGAP